MKVNVSFPTAKELKRLTAACRKAGISKFRHGDLEITLSDEAPVSTYKKAKANTVELPSGDVIDKNFKSDELGPDAMLFWSVGDDPEKVNNESN